ncbi:MAG TPA: DegQ family serine endoprotease [Arenimonas sp.]|jgi:serine protease Do|nr:DegQ family serine endoprotease [Arenimonas sp.]
MKAYSPSFLMLVLTLLAAPLTGRAEQAAPLVNLPDFTRLVEQAGPAVVNIEATLGERGDRQARVEEEELPEIFRRFFGQPGFPPAPGRGPRGVSQGTGFIISADGYVLTNHHVIDGASEILVRMADRSELKAELVGSDPLSDIALLKVPAKNLPTLALGDSRSLKPGQWVLAIGSPFGFDHSVTAGIVSGVGRRSLDPSQQYVPFIQTDVAINRGNSGGPLLNTSGEVVGINSQIFSNSGGYMGVSFAIPIEVAMNAVRQLRETGKVVRGQLGVRIQDVDRELAGELGLDRPVGAYVVSVENDSAAAKAGIRPGDVILAFNGQDIARSAQLPPLVGALAPGARASLEVLREGKRRNLVAVLEALEPSELVATAEPTPAQTAPDLLGLVVEELGAARRAELGLGAGEGVRIARVTGLAARQAGLNPGDVILQVGRQKVGSVAEFREVAKAYGPGDEVRLLVRNARSTGFVSFILR